MINVFFVSFVIVGAVISFLIYEINKLKKKNKELNETIAEIIKISSIINSSTETLSKDYFQHKRESNMAFLAIADFIEAVDFHINKKTNDIDLNIDKKKTFVN